MKIVVTGAAGFIGSHLCERLASLGHNVVGIDSVTDYYSPKLKQLNIKDIKSAGVNFVEADLVSDDIQKLLKGAEIIYHLAAQPGISDSVPFEMYLRNNTIATHRLLESVKNSDNLKCLFYGSTSSVYGAYAEGDEKSETRPTSYYGVTKLSAEQLILSYFREKDIPTSSIRLFSVYGERERPDKLYPRLIKSILVKGEECPVFEGSNEHKRSYTYVGDVVDGLVLALGHSDKCVGEIFNIGGGELTSTKEGIDTLENIAGGKANIVIKPKRVGDQKQTSANIEKAKRVLGYSPKVKFREGLKKEFDWYKDNMHKL